MKNFPNIQQLGLRDCGPTCLQIICRWYNKEVPIDELRQRCNLSKTGASLFGLSQGAESLGFESKGFLINTNELRVIVRSGPVILHWQKRHFVVLYKAKRNKFFISDPAKGLQILNVQSFEEAWLAGRENGHALLLTPSHGFVETESVIGAKTDFGILKPYIKQNRKYLVQIILGMLLGSLITLIGPFLAKSLIDLGVNQFDIDFIYLILAAQLFLFIGTTSIHVIRTWIVMHIGTQINISLVSDFFKKVLNLPMQYYDQYVVGELMQRISDYSRLEKLLTSHSLTTLFSILNIFVLGGVLLHYHSVVFLIFFAGSGVSLFWVYLFLGQRRNVDFAFFAERSNNNNTTIEIFNSVEDIKLSNSTKEARSRWERVQAKLYKVKIRSLTIGQLQSIGADFINRIVGLVITCISALAVIEGDISLGTMFAITMIVGQLLPPITQVSTFIGVFQDAKLGLERIKDILDKPEEEDMDKSFINDIPLDEAIELKNVSFSYPVSPDVEILKDVTHVINPGTVTAIVGASGSGKSTLLKLLLKYYPTTGGEIRVGPYSLDSVSPSKWREKIGVVMQESRLLTGSISYNVALGQPLDHKEVVQACKLADISQFVESLPQGYQTEIGPDGLSFSAGQKQRLLLARALYKRPQFLFLDEATSSLDARSETEVIDNLSRHFRNRTVLMIAHRLSTVVDADCILVLHNGKIVEKGSHLRLMAEEGHYYNLVKKQINTVVEDA